MNTIFRRRVEKEVHNIIQAFTAKNLRIFIIEKKTVKYIIVISMFIILINFLFVSYIYYPTYIVFSL